MNNNLIGEEPLQLCNLVIKFMRGLHLIWGGDFNGYLNTNIKITRKCVCIQ